MNRGPVIISVSAISVIAVFSNLTLLLIILSRKELRSSVFLWNVAGMCVCNLIFGTITNALGDSRHIYREWIHGMVLCKVFSVFKFTSSHIMSMIQIAIITSLFLKVRQSLSAPSNITSRGWSIFPYALFALPWLLEVVLSPMIIMGEVADLPEFAKKFGSLMCLHFLERSYRHAGVILFNVLYFILLILSVAVFLYYRFKKASYDHLLGDDALREDETLRSMLIASTVSSAVFCLMHAPLLIMTLNLVVCKSSWCLPSIQTFDAVYVLSCIAYAATPVPWFTFCDIKHVFREVMDKVTEKARASVTQCRECCGTKLESITVEWTPKQSDFMKTGE